ncbi:MAG: hypothetical protein Q4G25_16155 [Paracoccus sp. (in: a-proteobacteria)]|nr:hypothetical protein [Paracoccus sp. (in: a-proteobacteria)]
MMLAIAALPFVLVCAVVVRASGGRRVIWSAALAVVLTGAALALSMLDDGSGNRAAMLAAQIAPPLMAVGFFAASVTIWSFVFWRAERREG